MYRKLTADSIFTGTQLLPEGYVLITDEKGVIIEIVPVANAGEGIEKFKGVLTPGFINAHCHLELSHLKGLIPEHTGLTDFVFKIITQRQSDEDIILQAIKNAEDEMLQNGIVAVGDICNTSYSIQQKKLNSLLYHNFIEVTGFVPATAQQRFNAAMDVFTQFEEIAPDRTSLVPHAPYSVSPELFRLINNLEKNCLLTIHNQETTEEDLFFKNGTGEFLRLYNQLGIDLLFYKPTGKTSLQSILPYLNKQQQLILVHDVTTTASDIAFAAEQVASKMLKSVYFCLCPNANLYISNVLPNISQMIQHNCTIVLGTDSLASNRQLSILEEMKTLQHHFPQLTLVQLLQYATLNGAQALQMENSLGNFEKGKKPGVILIDNLYKQTLTNASSAKRIL